MGTELQQAPIREQDLGRLAKLAISIIGLLAVLGVPLWAGAVWVGGVNTKLQQLQDGAGDQKQQIEKMDEKIDRILERQNGIIPQKGKPQSKLNRLMITSATPQSLDANGRYQFPVR